MKYLRYGCLSIAKNMLFTVIMVLEIVVLLVSTNLMVANINSREVLQNPYEDIITDNSYFCNSDPNHDGPEEYDKFYSLFDRFKSAKVTFLNSTYIDDDVFFKMALPLKSGSWPEKAKDDQGRPYAVVTPDYLAEPGDVINIQNVGEVVVSGVLTDVTYLPGEPTHPVIESVTDLYKPVDFTDTLKSIKNGNTSMFTYQNQRALMASSCDKEGSYSSYCIVTYNDDISDEDIKHNEKVMQEIKDFRFKLDDGDEEELANRYEFKNLSEAKENTDNYVAEIYNQLIPIMLVVFAIVLIGLIGSVAINTATQIKNYGVYFLCGSKWSDCLKISFANILIILLFSCGISAALLYVGQNMNLDYLIGQAYGWNNLFVSIGMVVGMIVLSLVIPFFIIRFTSPVEVVKNEK